MPEPPLSVIVPAYAAEEVLGGCLDALAAQTVEGIEVLVVDDPERPSAEGVVAEREEAFGGRLRRLVAGPGPAERRNAGIEAARSPRLAFTDPDCRPEPGWAEAGLRALEGGAQIVQGRTVPPEGESPSRFGHAIWIERESGLFESCNIFYERDLVERLGGFSPVLFERAGSPFGEDAILGWRAVEAGARMAFEPDAVVRHLVFPPSLRGHLHEQWRAKMFPELVREVPAVRRILFGGLFLSPDTARFAAAAVGIAASPWRRWTLLLAAPWAWGLAASTRRPSPVRWAAVLAAAAASDAVRSLALWVGSVRARRPVL